MCSLLFLCPLLSYIILFNYFLCSFVLFTPPAHGVRSVAVRMAFRVQCFTWNIVLYRFEDKTINHLFVVPLGREVTCY